MYADLSSYSLKVITYVEAKDLYFECLNSYASEATLKYYRYCFEQFEDYLNSLSICDCYVADFSNHDLLEYVDYLHCRAIKNTSVRSYYRGIRSFFRWLYFNNYLDSNICERVRLPKDDSRLVKPLSTSDVARIDAAICSTNYPLRNACIFHLMLDCGLRVQEVCHLSREDINFDTMILMVNNSKNYKSRVVPVPEKLLIMLKEFTFDATEDMIKSLVVRLRNVSGVYFFSHLCRHTFATSYVYYGGNLEYLRLLLGHSSLAVTQEYLHLSDSLKACDYDLYRLPYIKL